MSTSVDDRRETQDQGDRGYGVAPPDFRLPDATRVGSVRLQVADLDRSIAYYRNVLGLSLQESAGSVASLGPHDDGNVLVELVERPGVSPAPRRGRLGLYHFAILVPDRATLGRYVAHIADTGERVGASDHIVSEALYLQDPDNLGVEVYADRPRETWSANARELLMDSRPLDLGGLMRAAGESPWRGMPAGTTLGHVHLHVGDLQIADAFYHTALGFDRVVWSYPGALFLSAGGYHHHLGVNTWAGPGAGPATEAEARLLEWVLVLPKQAEADAAAQSLARAGHPVERFDGGWLANDPWGTALQIVAAADS
jgi:catechol 2,3-dioxygenase